MWTFRLRLNCNSLLPFLLSILFAPAAYSFPDLIRKGYQSCVPCHVSPAGGGVLTSYGRGFSEELFTFPLYEGSGSLAGLPILDEWRDPTGLFQTLKADLQADVRTVAYQVSGENAPEPPYNKDVIPMERTAWAAFHVGKTTDLVLSYGQYGKDGSMESRVHYLQIKLSKFLSMRWGRFLPSYGINIDDHTAWIRSGLGFSQGHEAMGLEAHYEDENITSTVTRILGESVEIVDSNKRLVFNSETREGIAGRLGVKLGARHLIGVSVAHDSSRQVAGIFVKTAPIKNWLYVLSELDFEQKHDDSGLTQKRTLGLLRLGSEVHRGVTAGMDGQIDRSEPQARNSIALWLQLIPLPHFELRTEGRRTNDGTITALVMGHVWL